MKIYLDKRFITLVKKDSFDYTEWQRNLWHGKSIEEIHTGAAEYEKNKKD